MGNGMKLLITLIIICSNFKLFAQQLNGVVKDKLTRLPIQNVSIKTALSTTFTSSSGKFSLHNTYIGDTVKITCIGYEPYYLLSNKIINDTILIYLEQNSILLKGVTINNKNGYKLDSIRRRKEFASVFARKSPALKDIFISKPVYSYTPNNYITAPNSTASIVSINVLSVIGLLNKNKAPVSKLQKVLLKEEEDNYIDHLFSKRKVTTITSLKNDSLIEFMNKYRPSAAELKKMNDYDLIMYIKKYYQEFIKP